MAKVLHAHGKIMAVHMDGRIGSLKHLITQTSIDIVEGFHPPPKGDISLSEALEVASLKKYAFDLGLDTGDFNSCLDSGEKAVLVQNDLNLGRSAGISGTPSFLINGQLLVGARPLPDFKTQIDAALAQ